MYLFLKKQKQKRKEKQQFYIIPNYHFDIFILDVFNPILVKTGSSSDPNGAHKRP